MFKKLIALAAVIGLVAVSTPTQLTTLAAPTATTFSREYAYGTYYTVTTPYITISSTQRIIVWDIDGIGGLGNVFASVSGFMDSGIKFYNSSNVQVGDINFKEIDFDIQYQPASAMDSLWILDLDLYAIPTTAVKMRLRLAQTTSDTPSLTYLTENTYYDVNPTTYLNTVHFMSGLSIYQQSVYYLTPREPDTQPTAPDGYFFAYWRLSDGEHLYPYLLFTDESPYVIDDVLYVYAQFNPIPPSEDFPDETGGTTLNAITTLLAAYGLNDAAGQTFVYVVFLILANGLIYWWFKAPLLVAVIISTIITALWMVLGILPLFVSVIMLALMLYVFVVSMRTGGMINE